MKKRIIAALTAIFMLLSTGCGADEASIVTDKAVDTAKTTASTEQTEAATEDNTDETAGDDNTVYTAKMSTKLSYSSGNVNIERSSRAEENESITDGSWTILVYLCGSDLETNFRAATADISEMINAAAGSKYKFVVQTGGCPDWDMGISASQIERYTVADGSLEKVKTLKSSSMGDPATLASFIKWGVETYPADKVGLILWNHGGGSIDGVCFDDNYDGDCLLLKEIDSALSNTIDVMPEKFEFIGFDACLMGTLELANLLVPHAKYMYASQETESGLGWDYTAMGNVLASNPDYDGAELGRSICDSFYTANELYGLDAEATLACIDLSKVDALIDSFNSYAQNLYNGSDDSSLNAKIVRKISAAENYGGNNKSEGYTNMVDLGAIAEGTSGLVDGGEQVIADIKDCVIYQRRGAKRSGGYGLSIYYPLQVQGSQEMTLYREMALSPYYLAFVDKVAYGNDSENILSDYDDSSHLGDDSDFWCEDETQGDYSYWDNEEGSYLYLGDSKTRFEVEVYPEINEDEELSMKISTDTVDYIDHICGKIDYHFNDNLLAIGSDDDVFFDTDTGEVIDLFLGEWYSLSDGQILSVNQIAQCDDYTIFTCPVEVDGRIKYLRLYRDSDGNTEVAGIWDGINAETGMPSRDAKRIKPGTTIIPVYPSDDGEYIYGEEYVIEDEEYIEYGPLFEGFYQYSFELYDIYGNIYYTDYTNYYVDEDGYFTYVEENVE